MVMISDSGVLNQLLVAAGIIKSPLRLMYNARGVIIALTHALLPYMVLCVRSALYAVDPHLEEAAMTLGAGPVTTFLRVTLPLSTPGIAAGSVLVVVGVISAFVTPVLIGGGRVHTVASVVYEQACVLVNWPFAAAISFVLLAITSLIIGVYTRALEMRYRGGTA
jgi:ABC-type spermidine/putrescine transport system permease subunit I